MSGDSVQQTLTSGPRPAAPMPEQIADRYAIERELGHGGMGRVFAAHDKKLGRNVAIKVLAPGAHDEETLRRFEQEARAAGSLNHPNILAVYDIGTHESGPYIVSELLEGTTLRQRLSGKPLPWKKAVDIAVQLGKGLSAAHDKGVIHRDLKPENIFLCSDGRVKILDFGIAKLTAKSEHQSLRPQTLTGTIMGTIGYMSPEQVRGEHADQRSDIFSFGSIVYEMLSGKAAFDRPTPMETGSAILNDEPADLPASVPAELDRVVRRCLEKNAQERFQSAHELVLELATLPVTTGPRPAFARARWRWRRMLIGAALLAAAFLAGTRIGSRSGSLPEPVYTPLVQGDNPILAARFSPDGAIVAYSASVEGKTGFYTTLTDRPFPRPGLDDAIVASISRNGELALLLHARLTNTGPIQATLARMPLSGGAPREVLADVDAADWLPDGSAMAVVRHVGGRQRLEFPAGHAVLESAGAIGNPRVSPDGRLVAFLDQRFAPDDRGWVAVVDSAGNKRVLTGEFETLQGLAWSPSGEEIWFGAGHSNDAGIHAVALSGKERLLASAPGNMRVLDIGRDGRVLLRFFKARIGVRCASAGEPEERDCSTLYRAQLADIAADGKSVLVTEDIEHPYYGVYLGRADGSPPVRLGDGAALSFSADEKWAMGIIFAEEPWLVIYPTGPGEPRRIAVEKGFKPYWIARLLPDGKRLILSGAAAGHGMRLYERRLDAEELRPLTPEGVRTGYVPPDGKWLAFVLEDDKLHVKGPDGAERTYPFKEGLPGLWEPVGWSRDGSTAYLDDGGTGAQMRVYRMDLRSGRAELWKSLPGVVYRGGRRTVVVALDGAAYAYRTVQQFVSLYLLDGMR